MFRTLIVFAVLICSLSAVGLVSAGNSQGMGNYGSLLDITVKAPPSEPLGAPQPQVRGDTSQPNSNEFLQMLLPFFVETDIRGMDVTATNMIDLSGSFLIVATNLDLLGGVDTSSSSLTDPNTVKLNAVFLRYDAQITTTVNDFVRLSYPSGTPDSQFPNSIRVISPRTTITANIDLSPCLLYTSPSPRDS